MTTATARSRTNDNRRQRREEFMRAAADTLLELGLRDTKMDDIATRIGQSKVILYRHFASKDDLIHTILEREAERLLEVDRRPYEGGKKRAREVLDTAREDEASFLLLIRDARSDPIFGEHYRRVFDSIAQRIGGDFITDDIPEQFADISGVALTNFALDSTAYWIQHYDRSLDDSFIDWYAVGAAALCRGWRERLPAKAGKAS